MVVFECDLTGCIYKHADRHYFCPTSTQQLLLLVLEPGNFRIFRCVLDSLLILVIRWGVEYDSGEAVKSLCEHVTISPVLEMWSFHID